MRHYPSTPKLVALTFGVEDELRFYLVQHIRDEELDLDDLPFTVLDGSDGSVHKAMTFL